MRPAGRGGIQPCHDQWPQGADGHAHRQRHRDRTRLQGHTATRTKSGRSRQCHVLQGPTQSHQRPAPDRPGDVVAGVRAQRFPTPAGWRRPVVPAWRRQRAHARRVPLGPWISQRQDHHRAFRSDVIPAHRLPGALPRGHHADGPRPRLVSLVPGGSRLHRQVLPVQRLDAGVQHQLAVRRGPVRRARRDIVGFGRGLGHKDQHPRPVGRRAARRVAGTGPMDTGS